MANQILTEEHHRRPRSIGGTTSPANISYVKTDLHKAWHVLAGNMNAFQFCDFLNHFRKKPENIKISCKFINGTQVSGRGENNSKNERKIHNAWKKLFADLSWLEIIHYINNVWLDPSYHLYVVEIKKPNLR